MLCLFFTVYPKRLPVHILVLEGHSEAFTAPESSQDLDGPNRYLGIIVKRKFICIFQVLMASQRTPVVVITSFRRARKR
jgi:hypothetical protein